MTDFLLIQEEIKTSGDVLQNVHCVIKVVRKTRALCTVKKTIYLNLIECTNLICPTSHFNLLSLISTGVEMQLLIKKVSIA